VELSKAQDAEAGDGTTSVVVIAGSLLTAAQNLLERGYHPTLVSEAFLKSSKKAQEIMREMAIPVELNDRESLLKSAVTSLNSKVRCNPLNGSFNAGPNLNFPCHALPAQVVSQNANLLAPIAVDAVLKVIDPKTATNVDLTDVKVPTRSSRVLHHA
jgi:T-complex protein 1 subunit delta